jgi:hypothetical protein
LESHKRVSFIDLHKAEVFEEAEDCAIYDNKLLLAINIGSIANAKCYLLDFDK